MIHHNIVKRQNNNQASQGRRGWQSRNTLRLKEVI